MIQQTVLFIYSDHYLETNPIGMEIYNHLFKDWNNQYHPRYRFQAKRRKDD